MIDNITGIILAGGKSSRMGEDKSFMFFSGRPLIEILVDKLSSIFKDLIIVTNKPHLYPVRKFFSNGVYERYGVKVCVDIIKDRGPLVGIYTGLSSSANKHNFIVACDMPFLNQDLMRHMLKGINDYDIIVPQCGGRLHPLCAVYSKNCIKRMEEEILKNNLKIMDFFKYVKVKIITEKETSKIDSGGTSFVNINTPENYRRFSNERT